MCVCVCARARAGGGGGGVCGWGGWVVWGWVGLGGVGWGWFMLGGIGWDVGLDGEDGLGVCVTRVGMESDRMVGSSWCGMFAPCCQWYRYTAVDPQREMTLIIFASKYRPCRNRELLVEARPEQDRIGLEWMG